MDNNIAESNIKQQTTTSNEISTTQLENALFSTQNLLDFILHQIELFLLYIFQALYFQTRVRFWVSDFMNEMRKKSPVQKWVDSIPPPTSQATTTTTSAEQPSSSSFSASNNNLELSEAASTLTLTQESDDEEENNEKFKNNPKIKITEHSNKKIPSPKKEKSLSNFWSKSPIVNKFNQSVKGDKKLKENLSTYGKLKINEFYDKLNLNKTRFNKIKTNRMEVKNLIGQIKESNSLQNIKEGENLTNNQSNDYHFTFDDMSHDELLADYPCFDTKSESELMEPKRLGIGEIGRSASDNPSAIKKLRLGDIGRSFSETQNDEIDRFTICERNNSCPNPILNSSINFQTINNNNIYKSAQLVREQSFSDSIKQKNPFLRDSSLQSDSSRCSSVESLLESRKPDPEAILINLGFGPVQSEDVLSKIPKRFLKPSQVKGVNTEAFVNQQKVAIQVHDNSVLGYRGLVGNPHIHPSSIVAKIRERFQINDDKRYLTDIIDNRPSSAPPMPGPMT